MKFEDLEIDKITQNGYDKLLVMKEGNLLVGGSIKNVLIHMELLKNKTVIDQFGDQDIWVVDVKD